MLDKKIGNALAEDELNKVAGGMNMEGTDGDLRRVKCPNCGEIFMVNVSAKTAACPNIECREVFDIGTEEVKASANMFSGNKIAGVKIGKTVSGGFSGDTMKA